MAWMDDFLGAGGQQDPQKQADLLSLLGYAPQASAPPAPAAPAPPPPAPGVLDLSGYLPQMPSSPAPAGRGKPAPQPDYAQQQRELFNTQAMAAAKAQAAEDAQKSEVATKTALQETQLANRQKEIEDQRTSLYTDIDKRQKSILDEAANQPQIDPGAAYKSAGPVGAIAAAATGFLSGFINPKGGAQDVVQLIQGIADRNTQAQLANQEQRNKLLGMKQGALNTDLARGRDLLDSQLQASVRSYDSAIRLVNAEAQKNWGGEIGQAKAQQVIAGLESAKQEKIQQWHDKQMELGLQRTQVGIAGAAQSETKRHNRFEEGMQAGQFTQGLNKDIAAAGLQGSAIAAMRQGNNGLTPPPGLSPKEARALEVHGADGKVIGWANDDKTAQDARKQIATYEDVRKDLVDYKDLADKYGREFGAGSWSSDARKQMEAKHNRLMTTVKEVQKLGVLSGDDLKLLEGQIPGPQGWLGGSPVPQLEEAIAHADQNMDRYVKINIPGAGRYSPLSDDEIAAQAKKFGGQQGATIDEKQRTEQLLAAGKQRNALDAMSSGVGQIGAVSAPPVAGPTDPRLFNPINPQIAAMPGTTEPQTQLTPDLLALLGYR